MLEVGPGSIGAAARPPEFVRIVGNAEVVAGPDTKSQLAPSPGKTAARKQAHYRGATSSAYRMTLLLFTRRDTRDTCRSFWIGQQRDDRDCRDHGVHQHQHRLGARRHARKSVRLGKAQPNWQRE